MSDRPVIIGFDGTPAAEQAVREAAAVLSSRHAIVVTVWEAGRAYELLDVPTLSVGVPASGMDIRAATEVDHAAAEAAGRMAERGAALAVEAGMRAEGMVVADDITVAATLSRLAKEQDAGVIVVGSHGHRGITELLLGSTAREVLKQSPCPVLITRPERPVRHQ
ncbi:MAG TPA: universal stress protein [Pseudonocardiaceae bacterium]|jgi:nucleotide-binding universal stress UspA family protein|nr:universal stress protein [Pseudonocardiaceae bacterium]